MASEHTIQNQVRNALVELAHLFRVNVGTGWAGDAAKLPNGNMLIANPRPLSSGLPPGFSDLVGWYTVTVTEEMVGREVAIFTAIECKSPTGKPSTQQLAFLSAVRKAGGIAGIVRSAADAVALLQQKTMNLTENTYGGPEFVEDMKALNWTNEQASQKLGVALRTIIHWRTGNTPIPKAVSLLMPYLIKEQAAANAG